MGWMLIPMSTLAAIEAGRVTLAFRRWDRPRVKAGTRLRTAVGLVEVLSVEPVSPESLTGKDASGAGFDSRDALVAFLRKRPTGECFKIGLRFAGPDPRIALRAEDDLSDPVAEALSAKLAAMDRASKRGPWTLGFLRLIAAHPGLRAPDLASSVGWDTATFKRYVRKLKELGLTESLEVGYRLSPRGEAVLARLNDAGIDHIGLLWDGVRDSTTA